MILVKHQNSFLVLFSYLHKMILEGFGTIRSHLEEDGGKQRSRFVEYCLIKKYALFLHRQKPLSALAKELYENNYRKSRGTDGSRICAKQKD